VAELEQFAAYAELAGELSALQQERVAAAAAKGQLIKAAKDIMGWKAEKAPKRQDLQRYCLENGIKHKQADGIPDLCKALIASGVKPAQQPKSQGHGQRGRQQMQQQQEQHEQHEQQQQGRPRKGPQQPHAAPGTHSTPRKGKKKKQQRN